MTSWTSWAVPWEAPTLRTQERDMQCEDFEEDTERGAKPVAGTAEVADAPADWVDIHLGCLYRKRADSAGKRSF